MTLENALAMRAIVFAGDLYNAFDNTHGIYIFRWDLQPEFKIALIGTSLCGDTPEEVGSYDEWIENEGFEQRPIRRGHHAAESDWMLVEALKKDHIHNYTTVQRLVAWADLRDHYNQNPEHNPWPAVPRPEELTVFFKAR